MPKYKVGDVAALFPKPSAPKSDTGKKIQSMFEDFYKNSSKANKVNHGQFEQKKKQVNNKETISESPREDKKKKRKFMDNGDAETNAHDAEATHSNRKKAKFVSAHQNSNGKASQEEENYFPRNKKKSKNLNSKENSSFMHFDEDDDESFAQFQSEEPKLSDKKKKKKNKLSETEIFENDLEKFKNKSSKKMKTFVNSRNQSEAFDVTDTSAIDETMQENQSPEKKSKKKKNKKRKKDKIIPDEAVAQEGLEDIETQNEEPKMKQKSKKKKKSLSLENSLTQDEENQDVETEANLEEKDELSKVSLGKKKLQKKPLETAERISRTVFIGNLPVRVTRQELQRLFVPFGPIEAVRLRGTVPVKATIPKKIAAIKSEFHAGQKSCIAYIVYKEVKDAKEALSMNGSMVHDHHIIVNPAASVGEKKTYDDKRSIFIGNLPFDVEDEAIWSAFSACGEVEAVRAIRDQESGAGKGFGYVLFKNIDSKEAALKMEGVEISDRKIRIKEIKSNFKKPAPLSNNKFNAIKRKAMKLKNTKQEGSNSRKSLKKLMNKEKRNYQKKKIAGIFKKFSI